MMLFMTIMVLGGIQMYEQELEVIEEPTNENQKELEKQEEKMKANKWHQGLSLYDILRE